MAGRGAPRHPSPRRANLPGFLQPGGFPLREDPPGYRKPDGSIRKRTLTTTHSKPPALSRTPRADTWIIPPRPTWQVPGTCGSTPPPAHSEKTSPAVAAVTNRRTLSTPSPAQGPTPRRQDTNGQFTLKIFQPLERGQPLVEERTLGAHGGQADSLCNGNAGGRLFETGR